ncbi:melatonin receptor type 1B-A-like [Chrysoperla carnea]|uniref:melatonin receptor type 1B-A-like n=1 Tax=Chrysoperla carnea TaxID=189513 RepID=UPI001D0986D4|nr:melatonin receptor type 1B-A-like [Chrysoperla carnea]
MMIEEIFTAATRVARAHHTNQHYNSHHSESAVSPVTLSSDWSRVARLLLLATLAVIGSVGNVFMISAVMVEDHLKKRGNTFIVNVALADLLITGMVIPASTVAILASLDGSLTICRFQWYLAVLCFFVTVLTLTTTAIENYARLCCTSEDYYNSILTPTRITVLLLVYWALCGILSGLQFVIDVGFDYCTRKSTGLLPYQATLAILIVFMPIFITCLFYIRIGFRIRTTKARPNYKASIIYQWDYALTKTNMYSFILFLLFWFPFGIVLAVDGWSAKRTVNDSLFYNLAWFALSKSCINNFLYCITNQHFRNAYVNLFHYCCCKTTVSFNRRTRADGPGRGPSGDVRVHIIPGYNMYSYTSPQRSGGRESGGGGHHGGGGGKRGCVSSCRPSTSHRPNGRDVYEL